MRATIWLSCSFIISFASFDLLLCFLFICLGFFSYFFIETGSHETQSNLEPTMTPNPHLHDMSVLLMSDKVDLMKESFTGIKFSIIISKT